MSIESYRKIKKYFPETHYSSAPPERLTTYIMDNEFVINNPNEVTAKSFLRDIIKEFVIVYYEFGSGGYSEVMAVYISDSDYNKQIDFHEREAKKQGFNIVTESLVETEWCGLDELQRYADIMRPFLPDGINQLLLEKLENMKGNIK